MESVNLLDTFKRLTEPTSKNEDSQRRERILNILLLGSILLSGVASITTIVDFFTLKDLYSGAAPYIPVAIFGLFIILYILSRLGRFTFATYIFIFTYLIATLYTSYIWGIDIPQGLLTYALIVVTTGVLTNTKMATFVTVLISTALYIGGQLQLRDYLKPESYWKKGYFGTDDILMFIATLVVILLVASLSNREIENSLQKAKDSEEALKKERDLLETTVEERTKQLKQAQLEKIKQLYRLADLGKLTSGILHDLATPLNLISLNLEQLESSNAKEAFERATKGTRAIERYITAAQRQIQKQNLKTTFDPADEVRYVLQIFSHTAKEKKVQLEFKNRQNIQIYGNPLKFNQLVTNLIANALEAYENAPKQNAHRILVTLSKSKTNHILKIQDFGCGITKEGLTKIFNPFFSTKENGTGIGLTISKEIIETEFGGTIQVRSTPNEGTLFTIKIPL